MKKRTRTFAVAGAIALLWAVGLLFATPGSPGRLLWGGGTASATPAIGLDKDVWVTVGRGLAAEPSVDHLLGNPSASGAAEWPGIFDATVTTADLDGDGNAEIVAHSNDTHVYVFDAASGRQLARLPTTYPDDGWFVERILNEVAVGVMSPGEPPSLIIANHAGIVARWQVVPAESSAGQIAFERLWEHRYTECFWNPGMDAPAVLADANGDGSLEIFLQNEENGIHALRADGEPLWHHCWAGGNAAPVVSDLDGDGSPEAIFASDSGVLSVVDAATGEPRWSFSVAQEPWNIFPGSIPVSPTVADLEGKLPKEVLFTARHAPSGDPELFDGFNMAIVAVHQSTETWEPEALWLHQPQWANPLSYTKLVVVDADGDGQQDVLGMDWNTIGHVPGNWEHLGPAHVFRLTAAGEEVWMQRFDSWWSNKDILVADLDGDGIPEMLANGENEGSDGLWVLSADSGRTKGFLATWPWKVMRAPVLLDDGPTLRIAMPVAPDDGSRARGAILLLDLGIPVPPGGIQR